MAGKPDAEDDEADSPFSMAPRTPLERLLHPSVRNYAGPLANAREQRMWREFGAMKQGGASPEQLMRFLMKSTGYPGDDLKGGMGHVWARTGTDQVGDLIDEIMHGHGSNADMIDEPAYGRGSNPFSEHLKRRLDSGPQAPFGAAPMKLGGPKAPPQISQLKQLPPGVGNPDTELLGGPDDPFHGGQTPPQLPQFQGGQTPEIGLAPQVQGPQFADTPELGLAPQMPFSMAGQMPNFDRINQIVNRRIGPQEPARFGDDYRRLDRSPREAWEQPGMSKPLGAYRDTRDIFDQDRMRMGDGGGNWTGEDVAGKGFAPKDYGNFHPDEEINAYENVKQAYMRDYPGLDLKAYGKIPATTVLSELYTKHKDNPEMLRDLFLVARGQGVNAPWEDPSEYDYRKQVKMGPRDEFGAPPPPKKRR